MKTLIKTHAKAVTILLFFFSIQSQAQPTGILLSSDTVCAGNNVGTLSFGGSAGSILRWEFAYSSGGPWTPIAFTAPSYAYQNLLQTIFFRVVTQIATFPEIYSNVVQITCVQNSQPFTIDAATLQCVQGQSTASLTVPTNSGAYWEYSTNNWNTATSLSTIKSNTIIAPTASQNYKLRAYTTNFLCPIVYSNTLSITPAQLSNAGSISGTTQLCSASNSCTLNSANLTGSIVSWESAFAPTGPYTPISGAANLASLPLANLMQTTYYRTIVQNGNCPLASSPTHTIEIAQTSVGGFVSGSYSMCAGSTAATLILQGNTGTVNEWQTLNGTTWQSLTASNNTVIVVTPSTTSNFRAIVQNGVCNAAISNSHTLTVHPKPIVNFAANSVCAQSPITFSNQSTGSFISNWNFGDGNSSSIYSPSHIYASAGSYLVKLKCFSSFGCVDSTTSIAIANELPTASFLSNDSVCDGNPFNLFNNSTIANGSITTVTYNFGDGASQNIANAVHTYSTAGNFQVSQTVLSNFGCTGIKTKTLYVLPKPSVNFLSFNTCKYQNLSLQNLSGISNGYALYKWHFGNGDSSSAFQPNYVFQQAGTYLIQLRAISNYNCQTTITKPIIIHEIPAITLPQYSVCAKSSINLQAQLSTTTGIASVNFSFGDGSSSSTYQNQHTYAVAGSYPLSITLLTDSNCFASANSQILVQPQPEANFTSEDVCEKETIEIRNLSSVASGSLTFAWLLNANQSFNQSSPLLPELNVGTHTLLLISTSTAGCSNSVTKPIEVFPVPTCNITDIVACQNSTQLISVTSSISAGKIINYTWLRNSSFLSSEQQFSLNFTKSGKELLEIICESDKGCKSKDSLNLQIAPVAIASFSTSLACSNNTVYFTNTSNSSAANFSSRWKIDDFTAESLHLSHSNLKPGYHRVTLTTTTEKSCKDSIQQSILVAAAPELLLDADSLYNLGEQKYISVKGASSYTWVPASFLSDAFSNYVLCSPGNNITYTLFAQSPQGCVSTAILPIRVQKDYVLEIFNIITLNGNSQNDHFHINNIEAYPGNKVMIFDQNNQVVFEQTNYQNTWQGRNVRGELLAPGTYYYRISFEDSEKVLMGALLVMGD